MLLISFCFIFPDKFDFVKLSIDSSYDKLIAENFKWAIIEGNEPNSFSSDIKLVLFDDLYYKKSYTSGYWTPRSDVGDALLSTIKRGASVVIFDFVFKRKAPLILRDGFVFDDDASFLEKFRASAEEARRRGSVIILPYPNSSEMVKLAEQYNESVEFANFNVLKRSDDFTVRRIIWRDNDDNDHTDNKNISVVLKAYLHYNFPFDQRHYAEIEMLKALNKEKFDQTFLPKSKAELLSGNVLSSSRIIYRYLPNENIKQFGSNSIDTQLGVTYKPEQIISSLNYPDFGGKIVLLGTTFSEIGDVHNTVVGNLSGVIVLANALNMFLTDRLSHSSIYFDFIVIIFSVFAFSYAFAYLPYTLNLIITICLTYIIQFFTIIIFNHSLFFCSIGFVIILTGVLNIIYGFLNRIYFLINYVNNLKSSKLH